MLYPLSYRPTGGQKGNPKEKLERATRLELATFCLEGRRSTTELHPHCWD